MKGRATRRVPGGGLVRRADRLPAAARLDPI